MGQGAHQGSAPGKNLCTLPHSLNCPGGVIENDSWRACPDGYVFHGQTVPESGFVSTMNMSGFMSSTPYLGPAEQAATSLPPPLGLLLGNPVLTIPTSSGLDYSTAAGIHQSGQQAAGPPSQHVAPPAAPPATEACPPGHVSQGVQPQGGIISQQVGIFAPPAASPAGPPGAPPATPSASTPVPHNPSPSISGQPHLPQAFLTQPGTVYTVPSTLSGTHTTPSPAQDQLAYDMLRLSLQQLGEGARPKASSAQFPPLQPLPEVPVNIQLQVDALRAANQQVLHSNNQAPANLNIANLRAMPTLQGAVDSQWQHMRGSIPALSAARSALVPGVQVQQPIGLAHGQQHQVPLQASVPGVQPLLGGALPGQLYGTPTLANPQQQQSSGAVPGAGHPAAPTQGSHQQQYGGAVYGASNASSAHPQQQQSSGAVHGAGHPTAPTQGSQQQQYGGVVNGASNASTAFPSIQQLGASQQHIMHPGVNMNLPQQIPNVQPGVQGFSHQQHSYQSATTQ